jgi:hypothetical protein
LTGWVLNAKQRLFVRSSTKNLNKWGKLDYKSGNGGLGQNCHGNVDKYPLLKRGGVVIPWFDSVFANQFPKGPAVFPTSLGCTMSF